MPTATAGPNHDISGVVSKVTPIKPGTYLTSLQKDGYVVIRNLIPTQQLEALRQACKHITSLARNNNWPHVRTVPKQYPPWPENKAGLNVWGIQHLLHPDMPNRKTFANLYFGEEILHIVKELVGLYTHDHDDPDNHLVMELFNLLVSPGSSTDFELAWHRDDIKPDVTSEEEQIQLDQKSPRTGSQLHAQYNVALYDDSSLIAIPGSHGRIRTQTERDATPYQHLPDQVVVHLAAGDVVFYNSNILHRGVYRGIDEERVVGRMTLHGSVGLMGHGNERARQVLQHAVGQWVGRGAGDCFGLDGDVGRRAESMRSKLIAMGLGDDLGYSLDG